MYKIIVLSACGLLIGLGSWAQTGEIERVLAEIEMNNRELKAYSSLNESRRLEYQSTNNLSDPQLTGYYLPWGMHSTDDYWELEITQWFEFPTVYGARQKLIDSHDRRLDLEYQKLRQQVLINAKSYCLQLIFLNKRMQLEQQRFQQAKALIDQVQESFEEEEVGILDLNKAKIAWLQGQFSLENLETEINNTLLLLINLNGGENVTINAINYADPLEIAGIDSLWLEKSFKDPEINLLRSNEEISVQAIKLQKNQALPNLGVGFNHQGVVGESFTGLFGGLSLPLWKEKSKVAMTQRLHEYQLEQTHVVTNELKTDLQRQYGQYQLLLQKYRTYQTTLSGLNNESLLLRAYELGEISFANYYFELQFYRQAYDQMLQIENNLHRLRAELLKHQL